MGLVSVVTVVFSDLGSGTVTVVDKVGCCCSISIEMVSELVVVVCFFSDEGAAVERGLESLREPLREEPEEAVFEMESVRVGNSTGDSGVAGSGGSGGRNGGGSPLTNAGGFSPEVRPGTFQTDCIGKYAGFQFCFTP